MACLVEVVSVEGVPAAKDGISEALQRLSTDPEVLTALFQPLTEPPAQQNNSQYQQDVYIVTLEDMQ